MHQLRSAAAIAGSEKLFHPHKKEGCGCGAVRSADSKFPSHPPPGVRIGCAQLRRTTGRWHRSSCPPAHRSTIDRSIRSSAANSQPPGNRTAVASRMAPAFLHCSRRHAAASTKATARNHWGSGHSRTTWCADNPALLRNRHLKSRPTANAIKQTESVVRVLASAKEAAQSASATQKAGSISLRQR